MSHLETVYLDDLDGFDFEQLCQRVFERSGWGKVERIGGVSDGGRDLVIHRQDGQSIIVECKHQPNTTIGRPIVQKLHSAVISSGAVEGIVITTGRYSTEAIEHARLLSQTIPIRLFDLYHLVNLAQKSKIKIVTGYDSAEIFCFPVSNIPETKNKISRKLSVIQSHPKPAVELLKLIPTSLLLEPCYVMKVDIDHDFSTSVGLIHSIHEHDVYFIFDAQTGSIIDHDVTSFLCDSSLIKPSQIPTVACPRKRSDFVLDVTSLKGAVTEQLIRRYSAKISYRGRNNRSYQKLCQPSSRSIRINDTKQVLLPTYTMTMTFLRNTYHCSLIQNNHEIKFRTSNLYDCKICKEHIKDQKILLCNSCGNIAHAPKFFNSHSHICANCKKTICKNCVLRVRRFLFFKKKLCDICASNKTNKSLSKRIILDKPCQYCAYKNRQGANFCLKCGRAFI